MLSEAKNTYSPAVLEAFRTVTTATLTTVLLGKGLRNIWIRGAMPLGDGQNRIAGPAFTMRFVPAREDLATFDSLGAPISTRTAIETMPNGCVAVIDAGGVADAGVFGDILCARMMAREVAAIVTDGALRDIDGIMQTGMAAWTRGTCAPPSIAGLTFVGWGETVACGGVAVMSKDLIVADQDGVVVVPKAFVKDVIKEAVEKEKQEAWILKRVLAGEPLPGLYPLNDENRRRYEDLQ